MKDLRFVTLGVVPAWHERANCDGLGNPDHEVMFPEMGGSPIEAKRVCARCEVKTECLNYAIEHDEKFGVWGGKTRNERKQIAKRRAAQPEGVAA